MRRLLVPLLLASTALAGCSTLAPAYRRPALAAPQTWPDPAQGAQASAGDLVWRDVFQDPRLQQVIALAVSQNRDLRAAVADIARARAQYRVQRAELLPAIGATGARSEVHTPRSISGAGAAVDTEQYSATVGFSAFEIDIFGRIGSLSRAALQTFLATEENRRAVQISIVAETALAYLGLAADLDRLGVVRDTVRTQEESLTLAQKRFEAGAISELDLRQAQTLAEQARSDLAVATAQAEQDRNALRLVVGADIPPDLLPATLDGVRIMRDLPAGMPSDVLVRRPDVLAAEHALKAENANIGAARAAFFPRIVLTGATGSASTDLDGLFRSGTGVWSFAPQISLPIFEGGANIANLGAARARREIALARYERAVQTAFREVADALAVRATIEDRLTAQERLLEAAAVGRRLSRARYERGVDSYLTLLEAERTYYAAQQSALETRLAEAANRVTLYRALGGGWR